MRKALPLLFVASTVVITAASFVVSSNGVFTQLKAADNEVQHTITFTKNDVVSKSTTGFIHSLSLNKQTQSGFDFGCTVSIDLGEEGFPSYNNYIVQVEDDLEEVSISMSFDFKNVLSADSVTLNGFFEADWRQSYSFTSSTQTSDGYKINVSLEEQSTFYIDSIVVQYTCSY